MRPLVRALTLWLTLSLLWAANVKLYLKDGNFHVVREYKVEGDSVHYYSVELGDWEDIPVSLVDLNRTKAEVADKTEARAEEDKVVKEEEKALKEERAEITLIPRDPRVYMLQ